MDAFLAFAANHPFMVWGAVLLTAFALYNEFRLASRRGVDLAPASAVGLINQGAAVVDLRTFERYKAGHIVNAKHVPADDLDNAVNSKLKQLKDKALIVYDDNGLGGAKAVNLLRQHEFKHVMNLRGGIAAWERENLPLEKRG